MTLPNSTYLLLLGPPGSGKGTQASMLRETLGIVHVSSGDLFRANIKYRTKLGILAKDYIDRGELVPDDVTIGMVLNRLKKSDTEAGVLLDGYPRTLPQAEVLDKDLAKSDRELDLVLSITVPEAVLVDRISGRLFCRTGGESYHTMFKPPMTPGICDNDGGELYRREDDEPDTVQNRIQVYWSLTQPLIDYYQNKGVLVNINGDQAIDKVSSEIMEVLKERALIPEI